MLNTILERNEEKKNKRTPVKKKLRVIIFQKLLFEVVIWKALGAYIKKHCRVTAISVDFVREKTKIKCRRYFQVAVPSGGAGQPCDLYHLQRVQQAL